jgi:hypothetical protein
VLAADALFGLILLGIALAGRFSVPAAVRPAASIAPEPAALAAKFGGLTPAGQSTGMAIAADGSLALVDRSRQVVIRLDAKGRPLGEWGPNFGPGLDAQDLVGIAVDGDGWDLLDRGALRILRLDAQGQAQPLRTIDLGPLATYGPNGLVTDSQGNLYLADTGLDRLLVFTPDGALKTTVGSAGNDLGQFKQPMFLAFRPGPNPGTGGSLFVSDWENSRVEAFDANLHATSAWPLPVHSWGIAVDPLGRVFIPDGDHHLVRMFGSNGALLAEIGSDPGTQMPVDDASQVAVSPDGSKLWVLGSDGLAAVDLTPYAGLQSEAAPEAVNMPLAVLGGLLVLLAAVGTAWPRLRLNDASAWKSFFPERPFRVKPAQGRPAQGRPAQGRPAQGSPSQDHVAAAALAAPTAPRESPPEVRPQKPPASSRAPDRRRRQIGLFGVGLFAIGGIAAVVAELAVIGPEAKFDPWSRLAWLAAASLACAAGCVLSSLAFPWRWVSAWPGRASDLDSPLRLTPRLLALPAIAGLAAIAGAVWATGRFQTPDATRAALLWLVAIALGVATLALRKRLRRPSPWALVPVGLFLLALMPRAWNNANLPFGVWFDEAEAGVQARKFLQAGLYTPITDTYGRDASLFYYFISGAQALVSDPVVAGRLVSAIVGALAVGLMYLFGRELFGWQVGLLAAIVLATMRWHLDISRLGWDPISLTLCSILAFWLLARAVRTRRWSDAMWAGLAFGLGMHAYIAFRPLPAVGLLLFLYGGWLQRWPWRTLICRVGVMIAAMLLVALPVLIFAIKDPDGFNGRLNQTLVLNEAVPLAQKLNDLWTNLQKHLLMFHISGDMNGRHNLPGAPMLDPLSGLLMVIGLGVLIARPFEWRAWLLFGWAAASMAGGIFTFPFEAPQALRTLGVTPVIAVLIALALVLVLDRVAVLIRGRDRKVGLAGGVVAGALVAWIGVANLTMFFGRQMNDPTVWESFSTRETLPSRAAEAASQPYEAILGSAIIAPSEEQQLMVPALQNTIRAFDPSADLPYQGNGPALVILESQYDSGLANEVARYYPDAVRRSIYPPNGVTTAADEFELAPGVIAAHRGLLAGLRADGTWQVDLSVDTPGDYALRATPGLRLSVDGRTVAETDHVALVRGNHRVELGGTLGSGTDPSLEWQPPGSTTWQTIDNRLLFAAPNGGNGLQATFYPTQDFQGNPTETIIDPILAHYYHTNPLARVNVSPSTWSAEWLGEIDVPTTGEYRFEAERLSRAGMWIAEQQVFDDTVDGPTAATAGSVQLTAGRHAVRVRMQDRGDGGPRLYLYWTPPGGAKELVPGRVLYPPLPASAALLGPASVAL